MSNIVNIDGSFLEGGGQIVRMAVAFSVLQQSPINISKIRAGRSNPGLSAQHLKGVELAREMTNGKLDGAVQRSTEFTFYPGRLKGGEYLADTGTAGSISLLIQVVLPCALFSPGSTVFELRGGTNCEMAPQIDYTTTVFLRVLNKFGASFDYDLIRRGYFPKGGGKFILKITPVKQLKPVIMTDPGTVKRIWGTAFTAGNCPTHIGKKMSSSATDVLTNAFPNITTVVKHVEEDPNKAIGTGSGIFIFAETTTGCIFGASGLGQRNVPANKIGSDVAARLAQSIHLGACVDDYIQDQAIIFMALANGVSRILCGPITLHTETAIYFAELMTKATFTIQKLENGLNIIECTGIGLENKMA